MRITIKRIAEELGISHSTVSRVLNEKQSHLVSETMRQRIVETADRMGYRPSRIAQALQGKSTQLVGVFLPDSTDYFFMEVVRNLRQLVNGCGYELLSFACTREQIAATWRRLLQWDLDGVFVFDYLFMVEGLQEALTLHKGGTPPMVALFSTQNQVSDYVIVDFDPALTRLLDHMHDQGCCTFGYMALPASFHASEQRYRIFHEFVLRRRAAHVEIPIATGRASLMEAARLGIADWLRQSRPLPDGLFCQNDEIALGASRGLMDAGIPVPDRVTLAGCDDVPYLPYLHTPLTSVTLPIGQVCERAWTVLQERIVCPKAAPMQHVIHAGLSLRASTRRLPGAASRPTPDSPPADAVVRAPATTATGGKH